MKQSNAGLQLRRAISIQADRKDYLRSMLSRRQQQGFVRAPSDCNAHRCFSLAVTGERGEANPSSFRMPSPIRYSYQPRGAAMATSPAPVCGFFKTRCARTLGISGARSASELKEKDYLRSTLSRRQLQRLCYLAAGREKCSD